MLCLTPTEVASKSTFAGAEVVISPKFRPYKKQTFVHTKLKLKNKRMNHGEKIAVVCSLQNVLQC
jgi:hypothetical protein